MMKINYRFRAFLIGMLLYGTFPVAWWIRPFLSGSKTICIFRQLTGKECPFCGLTRSFASAVHGDFNAAFGYHLLWPLAVFFVFMIGTLCFIDAFNNTYYLRFVRRFWDLPIWIFGMVLILLTLIRL